MIQPSFSSHVISGGATGAGGDEAGGIVAHALTRRQKSAETTLEVDGRSAVPCAVRREPGASCLDIVITKRRMIACTRRPTRSALDDMPFQYIAIEGPIGVGKTSLAERLAARLDATAVLEETENPFLADFYAGRPGAALQTQLFYLLNRHRQQLTLRQADLFAQSTVCDYLFDRTRSSRT